VSADSYRIVSDVDSPMCDPKLRIAPHGLTTIIIDQAAVWLVRVTAWTKGLHHSIEMQVSNQSKSSPLILNNREQNESAMMLMYGWAIRSFLTSHDDGRAWREKRESSHIVAKISSTTVHTARRCTLARSRAGGSFQRQVDHENKPDNECVAIFLTNVTMCCRILRSGVTAHTSTPWRRSG